MILHNGHCTYKSITHNGQHYTFISSSFSYLTLDQIVSDNRQRWHKFVKNSESNVTTPTWGGVFNKWPNTLMDILILLTVIQMVSLNGAYEFTCPSQAHWNFRAKSMCKPTTNYTCLFDINLQINVYRDRCNRPRILGPGYKYVFQPNLNRAACSANRYQPFIFETVGYSDCTFKKSLCSSLGQETYANGDTRVDRKCICNTDRGYTFVRESNNQCYCNPSTEDCSCYLGNNPYNETVGLQDINCYHEMKMTRIPYLGDMFNISRTIKINEFDNNKYNIKYLPTNEYRIEAVKSVFLLSLAYVVVWIIVLRVMRRLIKTRSTPREFNIIECTDCSMTIGWFIDVPDECLSYELDHQVRGTDDWSTETFLSGDVMTDEDFLSGDVMKDEDGRRMYKLQNLKPETYYEFKMRSVYKDDVKSHYSESKTKQTLKLAPREFNIIECTDCSITIGWFIDVPDECLLYEVDHRLRGTDDWSTDTFLSGDVLKDEDGRRMYKLQNLKPETCYEFKMRSVYKDDVKSHYSESKTKQTLKLAPREFNIIECTDCSITIGWFIDVPDECLLYEVDHRLRGTDDWSTDTFLSGDVLKDEDGRRMYKLQNLKPETCYEFKMRSVYKDDVKSHYSESKTKQTLKLAPREFNIIECTDCSITIGWFIDVPDECLLYEVDHRLRGTDDWSTDTFLSGDVLKDEDGRRMYKLQNLKPETCYEFKMRSVYKDDVKSHYSESKTKQTLKLAPREFNIIECTDCSMTIGWFMDDSHECLSYELDHRLQGTDDWSTETYFSGDLLKDEDGRRMYKLHNLKPETYYEFKMRSVYKDDVKSHYSESQTKQTLKEVLQLSEEDKTSYKKLMQTSETENRYFVRTMIVGKETVGKTCLLKRLLKEDISDVTSTDGVDIVVRRCKINIEDGKWIIGKEIDDDKVSRIKRALDPNAKKGVTQNMQVDEKNLKRSEDDEMSTHQKDTSDTKDSQDESDYKNESAILAMSEDLTTDSKVNLDKNGDTNESSSLVMPEDFTSDVKFNQDNNEEKKESSSLVMPDDLVSNVFSKTADNTLSNLYALCELWDFAGQKEFYATHQAFLTSSAVYLVVADMKDDISKQGLSQCFADFQHIGEYVDFWFDSIHCHRTTKERPRYGHFDPPIILVFTGKDKYKNEADFMKREKELNGQLDQVLGFRSKYHHLHNKFYLSNIDDRDEEFEKLRYAIYETARKMGNWGKAFPLKWILLEHLIEINKNNGKNFINFTEMSNLAKHPDINILEKKDLLLFLRFQHNVGNIIFFENIRDLIILRPQWLADAFRCLVSDRVDNRRLHHLEDWTLFKQQGKISESLIKELFESKDGSQFSGQKINLYKVMEKLDIIVKIENSSYYIMPSAMPSSTFDIVCEKFGILTQNCKRTSWLCFKFEFLPPSFFNHISAWFIRTYNPSKVEGGIALYRGICMFDIDRSGGTKILVTMSTDTIAFQIVTFSEYHAGFGSACSKIYIEVSSLFEDIKQRYRVIMSCKLHFQCSDGYYFQDIFEYEKLTVEKECFCIQHKQMHRSDQIFSPWMNNEVKEIPDRTKINTTQDDKNPENKPSKEDVQGQTSVKTNLPVSVNLRKQLDIKQSTNENLFIPNCIKTGNTLVFTDCHNNRLIICNSDGTDIHHIPLSYKPYHITEIDSNTVAVSCLYDRTIQIINISTRSVTSTITSGNYYGISYNDNNLYVVINKSIIDVMDLTGKVKRTIPAPTYSIDDITVDRDRLICIDFTSSIYCCSLDGKVMWKFKKDEFQDLTSVTTDNDKNVYVTSYKTNTVIVISDDGEHHKELLTKSDGLDWPRGIYFDKKKIFFLFVMKETEKLFFLK